MSATHFSVTTNFLQCPITKQEFRDPVVAEDGHTYEREAITTWLKDHNGISPTTRKPLNVERLAPNLLVKQLIEEHFETSLRTNSYRFKLGEDVEQGDPIFESYGKEVFKAEWKKTKNKSSIILMVITSARAKKEAGFYVEMSKHPNVVRTYGLVSNPRNEVMLVQERSQHGNLLQLLKKRHQPLSQMVLQEMFIQIADGMSFLAYNNIVHADLACRNILVFRFDEENPKATLVKVTDFGLSRASSIYQSVSTAAATTFNVIPKRYTAPEVLKNPNDNSLYNEKSDMYSMGVLMWEAHFSAERPWSSIGNDDEVARKVIRGERLQQPPTCVKDMWRIIQGTMSYRPTDRPTFATLSRDLVTLDTKPQTKTIPPNVKRALDAIQNNQKEITLANVGLSDAEMKSIAEQLKENAVVHKLFLNQNSLSDDGAQAIADILAFNRTLNTVDLDNNKISSRGAAALARALKTNQRLISLRIGNNPLFDDGIQAICEAVKINKTLQELWIHGTKISSVGIKLVAEMLREETLTLQFLFMGNNGITDNDALRIADALKINTSLSALYMRSPEITDVGARALAEGIALHRRRFSSIVIVDDCSITDKGRDAIKDAIAINGTANK